MNGIIISPVITEKSMTNAEKGKYVFTVSRNASKKQIKKTVERKFQVHVTSVATKTVKGRTKRIGQRRVEVQTSPIKQAVVGVKQGEKIAIFDITG